MTRFARKLQFVRCLRKALQCGAKNGQAANTLLSSFLVPLISASVASRDTRLIDGELTAESVRSAARSGHYDAHRSLLPGAVHAFQSLSFPVLF